MNQRSARRVASNLPPEPLFVLGGISQYIGAGLAVALFEFLPARNVAFLRVVGAAVIVVAFRRSWRRTWTWTALRNASAFGSVLAAMNLAFYLAIAELPIGNAVAIEFLGPIAVAAFGARSRRAIVALVLAAAGVGLIAGIQPAGSLSGFGFALAAAALWAGYIVLGHRVARSGYGIDGLGVGMAVGALVIAPVAAPGLTVDQFWVVLLALGTGLFSNAIPYGIDQVIMARLTRARFALLQATLPVTAAAVAFIGLRQALSPGEIAGIGLVVVAIALTGRETEPPVALSGAAA